MDLKSSFSFGEKDDLRFENFMPFNYVMKYVYCLWGKVSDCRIVSSAFSCGVRSSF